MTTTHDRGWQSTLKTIGLLLAVPIALITIVDWIGKPSMDVSAVVTFGPFAYPPNLTPVLHRLDSVLSDSAIRAALDSASFLKTREDRTVGVRQLAREVRGQVARAVPAHSRSDAFGLRGYWRVQIENTGTQTVKSVRLSLPDAAYSCVFREAERETCADFSPLRIGELQPREIVRVTSWTSFEPSASDGDDIRLTHDQGIGDVVVRGPAGPFFRWLDSSWRVFVVMIVVIVTPVTISVLIDLYRARRKRSLQEDAAT